MAYPPFSAAVVGFTKEEAAFAPEGVGAYDHYTDAEVAALLLQEVTGKPQEELNAIDLSVDTHLLSVTPVLWEPDMGFKECHDIYEVDLREHLALHRLSPDHGDDDFLGQAAHNRGVVLSAAPQELQDVLHDLIHGVGEELANAGDGSGDQDSEDSEESRRDLPYQV